MVNVPLTSGIKSGVSGYAVEVKLKNGERLSFWYPLGQREDAVVEYNKWALDGSEARKDVDWAAVWLCDEDGFGIFPVKKYLCRDNSPALE